MYTGDLLALLHVYKIFEWQKGKHFDSERFEMHLLNFQCALTTVYMYIMVYYYVYTF